MSKIKLFIEFDSNLDIVLVREHKNTSGIFLDENTWITFLLSLSHIIDAHIDNFDERDGTMVYVDSAAAKTFFLLKYSS